MFLVLSPDTPISFILSFIHSLTDNYAEYSEEAWSLHS